MPMRITAAICTHNRAALLPAAIESLLAQSLPPTDYELLVIDNASTDATPQVMQRYLTASGSVTLRSAVQPVLGLSHARNLAVEMAAGEIIAFMDDDAVATPGWLEALLDVYAIHPEAWVVGGKVLPVWDGERPVWLTDDRSTCALCSALATTRRNWRARPSYPPPAPPFDPHLMFCPALHLWTLTPVPLLP